MINSLYIHIPFCKKICSYCDFPKRYYHLNEIDNYLNALDKEIKESYQFDELKTVYIGGGTPSCLSTKELEKLFSIINKLNISNVIEYTFECNIEDITEELLNQLSSNKVNRLSIGIQTTNKVLLKYLNREIIDVEDKLELLNKYNFNYNLDFIYAIKNQTIKDLEQDIKLISKFKPNHLSFYSLIIEEHTVLKDEEEIDEELYIEMTNYINKELKALGYNHYEISNYSKEGYSSLHNLTYWNNEEYYGFGLGASSYIKDQRITNTGSMKHYLEGKYIYNIEELTTNDKMSYEMILGLRKLEGVNKNNFQKKFNTTIEEVFSYNNIKDLIEEDETTLKIKEDKLNLSNEVMMEFIKE